MNSMSAKLELSEAPDGFGFLYDKLQHDDEQVTVNIMPLVQHWAGHKELKGFEPDSNEWMLYLDGEGSAASRRQTISTACVARLIATQIFVPTSAIIQRPYLWRLFSG